MADEPQEQTALVPVREQTVAFYGDAILAAQTADETVWVPLRPISDHLGLNWSGQRQRLNRDPVLAPMQGVCVIHTPTGPQPMLCLPLDLLPGWLAGVNAARIKPELRDKIIRYQRECFRILWNAFKGDILPAQPAPPLDLSPAEQALLLAEAVASLARQHLELEQKHTTMADFLRPFVQQTRQHQHQTDARLTALELQLSGGATISEAQALELAEAVKGVALAMHAATGEALSTAFPLVWTELHKRYGVAAYRNLPTARYAEATAWLRGWADELMAEGQH